MSAPKRLTDRALADVRVAEAALAKRLNRYPFFHEFTSAALPVSHVGGRRLINLGSNNYLGLSVDPRVVSAAHEATDRWGTGVTGSRLLNGNLELHRQLEHRLASFYGKEAALVFPTGYTANLGAIAGLVEPTDRVLVDKDVHASLLDGVVLSGAKLRVFPHDDAAYAAATLRARPHALCVVEGVYSMRGNIADLTPIVEACDETGTALLVDEAHGLGAVGARGRGAAEHLGILDRVDLITVTFSKSLASCGGAVIGSQALIESLKLRARPFLFTASNTPASIASADAALAILSDEPAMVSALTAKAAGFATALRAAHVPVTDYGTPILTVPAGSDFRTIQAWQMLRNRGVFSNPVVFPGVPKGGGLLRLSLMRTHDDADLAAAVQAFAGLGSFWQGTDPQQVSLEAPTNFAIAD